MLRSKWHCLLSNLVLLYLVDMIGTRWKFVRAFVVCNKCANNLQATGAWQSVSILKYIFKIFNFLKIPLTVPVVLLARISSVYGFSVRCTNLPVWTGWIHHFITEMKQCPEVCKHFPNLRNKLTVSLWSLFWHLQDVCIQRVVKASYRRCCLHITPMNLPWVSAALMALGLGTSLAAMNSGYSCEIFSPWSLSYWRQKKRVYQQRAAVVCSHRVLIRKSLRDTYCCHLVLIRWKMPQLRGDRKRWAKGMCVWLQRNTLLPDNSEIWQSCLTRNLFTMTEIKREVFRLNGLGSQYNLAIA